MSLEKVQISDLGQARRVTITKDSTTIVANENQNTELSNRIASIKRELEFGVKTGLNQFCLAIAYQILFKG